MNTNIVSTYFNTWFHSCIYKFRLGRKANTFFMRVCFRMGCILRGRTWCGFRVGCALY